MYSDIVQALVAELISNVNITNLLSKDSDSNAMLINDTICPDIWGLEESTLNFYETTRDSFSCYGDITFTCNCRAFTYTDSKNIAETIKTELHEKDFTDGTFVVTMGGTINPSSENDNYNTVIDINVKKK